jgi:hypothetical protein
VRVLCEFCILLHIWFENIYPTVCSCLHFLDIFRCTRALNFEGVQFSIFCLLKLFFYYVAKTGQPSWSQPIFIPQPPNSWDYSYMPPYPVLIYLLWYRVWTLGLTLARQALYHLSQSSSPVLCWICQDRVSWTIALGWLWTAILLICASWVARITWVNHWCPALVCLFIYLQYLVWIQGLHLEPLCKPFFVMVFFDI